MLFIGWLMAGWYGVQLCVVPIDKDPSYYYYYIYAIGFEFWTV